MKMSEMKQVVNLLCKEWDLGKTESKAYGKICGWIYLFEILEESEEIIVKKNNNKVIGICGYSKWNSKRNILRKKIYRLLKNLLIISPFIKNKKAIYKYIKDYDYTPKEIINDFDGEITILLVDENYRGKGIGKKILLDIFQKAKNNGVKSIEILTDESCNHEFYKKLDCIKVFEKTIPNGEPDKCGNIEFEMGYIYKKVLEEEYI